MLILLPGGSETVSCSSLSLSQAEGCACQSRSASPVSLRSRGLTATRQVDVWPVSAGGPERVEESSQARPQGGLRRGGRGRG